MNKDQFCLGAYTRHDISKFSKHQFNVVQIQFISVFEYSRDNCANVISFSLLSSSLNVRKHDAQKNLKLLVGRSRAKKAYFICITFNFN